MERLNSIEEYKELTRQARVACKNPFSNNYYMPNDIQRYIELGQAYYEQIGNGFLLILDEEKYFRVCFYIDSEQELIIPPMDKRVVVKNVYRKDKGEECPEQIETWLKQMNFEKTGTSVQVKKDIVIDEKDFRAMERYAHKLEDKGWRCSELDESYYEQADKMLLSTGIIRDYQFDYRTPDEKKQILKGSYMGIFNDKEELCAVGLCYIEGKNAYGEGVLVLEEYKKHGVTSLLGYHRTKWLLKNGAEKSIAWILVENEASLRYHKGAGYKLVNKYVDEWVRDNGNK